ncbi:FAD dependent oxidoreductase [Calycina marina]|uniref:FAD dependent oxidoreductase n=1 Tax=Calycina marina TaxID=1763456 RepID=A0A9P7YXC6_9HELO|nr:FAD dependent oxidoreductase [Calycina marina]
MAPERNIVIVGGGIIGCTTAYFLTRHPSYNPLIHNIIILEASSIAAGASGKAGGLLALWAYPTSIVPLSYRLHKELADEHDGAKRWGYRTLKASSLSAKGKKYESENVLTASKGEDWNKLPKLMAGKHKSTRARVPDDLDWFDHESIQDYSEMGDESTTAQVHPYHFTTSMADLAAGAGASVVLGHVTEIDHAGDQGVKSVTYEDKITKESHTIAASDVILAAGPWTSRIYPKAPIEGTRAHSIVIEAETTPYAIFSEIELPKDFKGIRHGDRVSPEMYARPDGTVYACGEADDLTPLPNTADLVEVDDSRCQDVLDYVGSISKPLRTGKVIARQACYLPSVTRGNGPMIGETGVKGLLIAAGHTCWGIQNSCATGKLLSEFVFDGKAKSANIGGLDPRRVI